MPRSIDVAAGIDFGLAPHTHRRAPWPPHLVLLQAIRPGADMLYVHGGQSTVFHDDLHRYNFKLKSWSRLKPKGAVPSARR